MKVHYINYTLPYNLNIHIKSLKIYAQHIYIILLACTYTIQQRPLLMSRIFFHGIFIYIFCVNLNDVNLFVLARYLPKIYQAFMMSATLSTDVQALKHSILHNPVSDVDSKCFDIFD